MASDIALAYLKAHCPRLHEEATDAERREMFAYVPRWREVGVLRRPEQGGGLIPLRFCPYIGTPLFRSLRAEWEAAMRQEHGDDVNLLMVEPSGSLQSEDWWKGRPLTFYEKEPESQDIAADGRHDCASFRTFEKPVQGPVVIYRPHHRLHAFLAVHSGWV